MFEYVLDIIFMDHAVYDKGIATYEYWKGRKMGSWWKPFGIEYFMVEWVRISHKCILKSAIK